jgi:hypothetical protein
MNKVFIADRTHAGRNQNNKRKNIIRIESISERGRQGTCNPLMPLIPICLSALATPSWRLLV